MSDLRLVRTHRDSYGTFGDLVGFGLPPIATCEPRWQEWSDDGAVRHTWGVPYRSCVPTGVYELIWHQSRKYGWRWHLVGAGVYLDDQGDGSRFACLLHAANWPEQLQGCIAPGLLHGQIVGQRGVGSSGAALRVLEEHLDTTRSHRLSIVNG